MKTLKTIIPAFSFLILSLFIQPSMGWSASRCSDIFSLKPTPQIVRSIQDYGVDVAQSRGLRLVLKDSKTDGSEYKWQGFLTKPQLDIKKRGISKYLSAIASYVPRKLGALFSREEGYRFTPIHGIYNLTFRRPVEFITQKFSNRKMEPAFFFKFPVVTVLSLASFMAVDTAYKDALDNSIRLEISQNAEVYNHEIQSDFRYVKIKESLERGQITLEDAQREAYSVGLAYSQYFEFRDSTAFTHTLESDMQLINHYLFVHLKSVIEEGVKKAEPSEGYIVPDSVVGPLSEKQKIELFDNNHQRYLKYQIIVEMVRQSALWEEIAKSPNFKELVTSMTTDPFTIELYRLRDEGKITNDQLQSYLQEDVYWENRFQDWQTIGVTRLKKENGVYTGDALTLSDIRQEILNEISF